MKKYELSYLSERFDKEVLRVEYTRNHWSPQDSFYTVVFVDGSTFSMSPEQMEQTKDTARAKYLVEQKAKKRIKLFKLAKKYKNITWSSDRYDIIGRNIIKYDCVHIQKYDAFIRITTADSNIITVYKNTEAYKELSPLMDAI